MRVKISGEYYDYFTGLNIDLKLDSIASVFSFDVRFNPANQKHRTIFKPLTYKKVELFNNADELIFTGVILTHSFKSDQNNNLLSLAGYSLPGVLEDVTVPVDN